ncbi:hypothetical protein ACFUTU_17040 [Arthrobacter sp. NPDC057388]|uniref:hypothetical protein n=1 Tax=Arthrobacter sp. NPDC057388 TaxID=3346116 RepID=UPI00363FCC7E
MTNSTPWRLAFMAASPPPKGLRVLAVPGVADRKRWQRIHRKTRHRGPAGFLCTGHVLLIQPRPLRERVIGDDVLLDEAADG